MSIAYNYMIYSLPNIDPKKVVKLENVISPDEHPRICYHDILQDQNEESMQIINSSVDSTSFWWPLSSSWLKVQKVEVGSHTFVLLT